MSDEQNTKRITSLEINIAGMSSDIKHMLTTLNDIKKNTATTLEMQRQIVNVEKELDIVRDDLQKVKKDFYQPRYKERVVAGSVVGAVAGVLIGVIEILRHFFG